MGHYKRNIVYQEIQDCFVNNCRYENKKLPEMHQLSNQTYKISRLLETWRENGKLRLFLENIQNHFRSVTIIPLNLNMFVVSPQRFEFELFEKHYQIRLNLTDQLINQKLLKSAQEKFLHAHSNYFIKPKMCVPITNEQKEFPKEIFPSTDSQVNPLSDITNYFKEHLTESWKKFNLTEEYENELPSVEEINQFLNSFHQESAIVG
jgi:hypothetical protein